MWLSSWVQFRYTCLSFSAASHNEIVCFSRSSFSLFSFSWRILSSFSSSAFVLRFMGFYENISVCYLIWLHIRLIDYTYYAYSRQLFLLLLVSCAIMFHMSVYRWTCMHVCVFLSFCVHTHIECGYVSVCVYTPSTHILSVCMRAIANAQSFLVSATHTHTRCW